MINLKNFLGENTSLDKRNTILRSDKNDNICESKVKKQIKGKIGFKINILKLKKPYCHIVMLTYSFYIKV